MISETKYDENKKKIKKEKNRVETSQVLQQATEKIQTQLEKFGSILTQQVIPLLKKNAVLLVYKESIPAAIKPAAPTKMGALAPANKVTPVATEPATT